MKLPGLLQRILKFNTVGAIGIVVQTGAFWLLVHRLGLANDPADAIAVEIAVLHNFVWHENWTWRDRTRSHRGALGRLIRFNLSNGLISICVNVLSMHVLSGHFHWPDMIANLVGITAGCVANYLASDRFVFPSKHATTT